LSWQIILILVGAAIILISYLVLFILLAKSKKKLAKAHGNIVRLKGAWQESKDIIQRIKFLQESEEKSDEEAKKELFGLIDNWDAVFPNGSDSPF